MRTVDEGAGTDVSVDRRPVLTSLLWVIALRWVALAIVGWLIGWYSIVPAFDRSSTRGMYLSAGAVVATASVGLLIPRFRLLRPLCIFVMIGAVMATTLFVDITQNGLLPA